MLYRISGWSAIVLSLLALYPSYQTGALSVIGFYLGLFALLLSSFASHTGNLIYYRSVFVFSVLNVFFVNDGTCVMLLAENNDWVYIGSMYGIFIVISSICGFLVNKDSFLLNIAPKVKRVR
ncbi:MULTISPECIES: hypothetical protein [unclassified Pseudoalteromonas]|uniref:hypothetical protein n=1 Tax=unclassified Pseudoalteromonas TaxID=194690 RepID=UPI002096A8D9|nr:hypothetical protein [Pseudoalteromonas sp. XMcav2-N]MCO7187537.1 hypothetical protein [Pseudoalteromonas sp. XMcav2-N]